MLFMPSFSNQPFFVVSPGTPPQYGTQTPSSPSGMGVGSHALGRALTGPEVHLSGKHDGLVRYLSRLLRPLWNEPVATSYKPPGDMQNEQVPTTLHVFVRLGKRKKKMCN